MNPPLIRFEKTSPSKGYHHRTGYTDDSSFLRSYWPYFTRLLSYHPHSINLLIHVYYLPEYWGQLMKLEIRVTLPFGNHPKLVFSELDKMWDYSTETDDKTLIYHRLHPTFEFSSIFVFLVNPLITSLGPVSTSSKVGTLITFSIFNIRPI